MDCRHSGHGIGQWRNHADCRNQPKVHQRRLRCKFVTSKCRFESDHFERLQKHSITRDLFDLCGRLYVTLCESLYRLYVIESHNWAVIWQDDSVDEVANVKRKFNEEILSKISKIVKLWRREHPLRRQAMISKRNMRRLERQLQRVSCDGVY